MRVAVFTDADFDRATNITTTPAALLRHAPQDVRPRIYLLSDLEVDEPERVYALYRDATRPGALGVRMSLARTAVRTARAQR
jgi:hypothetical protein